MRHRLVTAATIAARGGALFLAALGAIGVVGELRGRTTNTSLWWIDLRDVSPVIRLGLVATLCGLLLLWAVRRTPGTTLRRATTTVSLAFAALALRDALRFYGVVDNGQVRPWIALPLSLVIAVMLVGLALVVVRERREPRRRGLRPAIGVAAAAAAWAFVFPLAQMLFFGTTDYRRPADVAVVLGARVYADGRPSLLLEERVDTAIELYRSGLVPRLIMSGGTGADGHDEALVMRDLAIAAGVDPAAIVVDPTGVSTEATAVDVMAILRDDDVLAGARRVIVVSQAYHLPRIQLAFANAGLDVLTVPATELRVIREMPIYVLREVPAFWAYYLGACLG